MRFLSLDCESENFSAGNMAPHLICVSWFNGTESGIFHWKEAEKKLISIFNRCSPEAPLIFHNAPYDLAVFANQFPSLLPLIFNALDKGCIRDTLIRERLYRISQGTTNQYRYSLAELTKRYFDVELDKTTWRGGYGELKEIPVDQWQEGYRKYAIDDAVYTGKIYLAQNELPQDIFYDEPNQNRASFALRLVSNHGIMTDPVAIAKLKDETLETISKIKPELIEAGLIRKNDTRNMKLAEQMMVEAWPDCPRTPTGKPCTDEESCESSGHPLLIKLSQYRQCQTLLSKDVESLEKGIHTPIHTRFESLLDTGRTSSSSPNIQNPRRAPGVRECYVPRPGYVFVSCDYEMAELHTLAQVCYKLFGHSELREKLNANFDPHLGVASQLLGITYEEAVARKKETEVKNARQTAKIANFGLPGGMGVARFIEHAANQGVKLTRAEAQNLKDVWLDTWPEMRKYFDYISKLTGKSTGNVVQMFSNRRRGNVRYTEACNTYFQGMAADGAKDALYEVIRACHLIKKSPLYGCRVVNFVHDELIVEVPENNIDKPAKELARIMVDTFNKWTIDVHDKAESCAMRCWTKAAQTCYDSKGELIVWETK